MGCQTSAPAPVVLKTSLLKTNHPALNAVIEEAEQSLQDLARICNPLEVAIDRFFSLCGREIDEGFRSCFLALILALLANSPEGGLQLIPDSPGIRVKTQEFSEQLKVEFESWRQLASELDYTVKDLSENLINLMDCAMTSHKLSQALVQLAKTEELRVVDLRKVLLVLDKNEETIRTAAEVLHQNVRRARKYAQEADLITQWMRRTEGWNAVKKTAEELRKQGIRSALMVLDSRLRDVDALARACPMH